MFDILSFLKDYKIPYDTQGKNTQDGWVQIRCNIPGCTDTSNHGGWNLATGHYHCWRCKHSFNDEVIISQINCTKREAEKIEKEYEINYVKESLNKKIKSTATTLDFPSGTKDITDRHRKYLTKRNFDPYDIEYHWGIKGTNQTGEYRFRIIAPVMVDGKMVSYQGRDITNKQELRYKACKIEDEIIHHKNVLYGIDNVKNKSGILLEGITDVWRLGKGAVATFGTTYTVEQINFIINRFERLFILFDSNDPMAMSKAEKLSWQLSGVSLDVEIIELDYNDDPGSLPQKEATYIRRQLLNY